MNDEVKIYHAEAVDFLRDMEDGAADMVLMDPPFGTTSCKWDRRLPWSAVFPELWRVLKPDGALVTFAQNPQAAELIVDNWTFFRHEWVWEKPNAVGFLNANRAPLRAHELILVFSRKPMFYAKQPIPQQTGKAYTRRGGHGAHVYNFVAPKDRESTDGRRCPRDVVRYGRDAKRWGHPTQKPEALLKMLIGQYTRPGEIVLDPFCGSGSTPAAALAMGRRAVGIEIDRGFYETACRRLGLTPEEENGKDY